MQQSILLATLALLHLLTCAYGDGIGSLNVDEGFKFFDQVAFVGLLENNDQPTSFKRLSTRSQWNELPKKARNVIISWGGDNNRWLKLTSTDGKTYQILLSPQLAREHQTAYNIKDAFPTAPSIPDVLWVKDNYEVTYPGGNQPDHGALGYSHPYYHQVYGQLTPAQHEPEIIPKWLIIGVDGAFLVIMLALLHTVILSSAGFLVVAAVGTLTLFAALSLIEHRQYLGKALNKLSFVEDNLHTIFEQSHSTRELVFIPFKPFI
ncbi:hypothetical protein SeMB42_g01029 [Synchytrium endobioticum]|uniref:Uncharacterized protein n=1 Tax=Synchytrium endobioticum TaxID=286115 RepID=A0A507DN26_9FUNG|nr:hypothetical protein SeMB42_g01029 [Synchytrium endobioticum]